MTWFIAIVAVIILGAAAGAVWEDRRNLRPGARGSPKRASFWCPESFSVTVLMILAGIAVIAPLIH